MESTGKSENVIFEAVAGVHPFNVMHKCISSLWTTVKVHKCIWTFSNHCLEQDILTYVY